MKRVGVAHVVYLTIDEEQRFAYALVKRYGTVSHKVAETIKEALMAWIQKVESEK